MADIRNEIIFWTGIMRDHSEFQYTSLSPNETTVIESSMYFMKLFESLHDEAMGLESVSQDIVNKNVKALSDFVQFKKMLIADLMTCKIKIGLSPTFLNHMVNEAMEYYIVLSGKKSDNLAELLHLHKVWLGDASGHAKHIASQLDGIESLPIKEARDFEKQFDKLFKKAFELSILFERVNVHNGEIGNFNQEVEKVIREFNCFLMDIGRKKEMCKLYSTGTFNPLTPDHMLREENYYLYRIKSI